MIAFIRVLADFLTRVAPRLIAGCASGGCYTGRLPLRACSSVGQSAAFTPQKSFELKWRARQKDAPCATSEAREVMGKPWQARDRKTQLDPPLSPERPVTAVRPHEEQLDAPSPSDLPAPEGPSLAIVLS